MDLVPINEEDKKKPYYKYYAQGIEQLTEEDIKYIENSIGTVEESLPFSERIKFQQQISNPLKTGVYPLLEGGYLVASNIEVPDITADMMWWWTAWHCLDHLRYSCWDPEDHVAVDITEQARKKILDYNVPIREKTWGTIQTVRESVEGDSPDPVDLCIKAPADAGFDESLIGTPGCQYISAATAKMGPIKVVIAATLAKNQRGVNELRERFWMGYEIVDGKDVCLLPADIRIPNMEEKCKAIIRHNFKEYRNLNKILPSLYDEYKDNWLV